MGLIFYPSQADKATRYVFYLCFPRVKETLLTTSSSRCGGMKMTTDFVSLSALHAGLYDPK
jgi:hypothetical protein